MSEKQYCIVTDEIYSSLLAKLIESFGLPQLQQEFTIFSVNEYANELHVNLTNNKIRIRLIRPEDRDSTPLHIENRNIKRLIQIINELGFVKGTMGLITSFSFERGENEIKISKSTFLGTLLEFKVKDQLMKSVVTEIVTAFDLEIRDSRSLQEVIKRTKIPLESIFTDFNCLNPKIKNACSLLGIDISSVSTSLKNRFQKFSNDYSSLDRSYKEITGCSLNGTDGAILNKKYFKPLSIVIPCYNTEKTIKKVLRAIQEQNLPLEKKEQIQVILVDDGSTKEISSFFKKGTNHYDFQLDIIRLEQNGGLARARNIGVTLSKHEHIIFIDSDILISRDYLLEHSVRAQVIPNCIFVSMKKNVEDHEVHIGATGLPNTRVVDDMRLRKNISEDQPSLYSFSENSVVEILDETDYFKSFSYGRHVGIFDLPSMVIGHNMSLKKEIIQSTGGFSNEFQGWGMEDSFFGARAIALGNYVVPVLSVNVYHINHPPRSGSEEQKQTELRANIEKYKSLLDSPFPN